MGWDASSALAAWALFAASTVIALLVMRVRADRADRWEPRRVAARMARTAATLVAAGDRWLVAGDVAPVLAAGGCR